jgi:DNA modification methylase
VVAAAAFCARIAEVWSARVRRRIIVNTGNTAETSIDPKGRPGVRVMLDAMWVQAMEHAGWALRHRRIWVKGGPNPHTAPHMDSVDQSCEALLTFWRVGKNEGGQERTSEPWSISGYFDDIKGVGKDVVGDDHPCPYPAEMPRRFILLYSKPGDIVAEPFSGAGTTIIAAEMVGRRCYAMEMTSNYVDTAVRRWQKFTGERAMLATTGATFEETAATRWAAAEDASMAEPAA